MAIKRDRSDSESVEKDDSGNSRVIITLSTKSRPDEGTRQDSSLLEDDVDLISPSQVRYYINRMLLR